MAKAGNPRNGNINATRTVGKQGKCLTGRQLFTIMLADTEIFGQWATEFIAPIVEGS
jgi:hypothetical protein